VGKKKIREVKLFFERSNYVPSKKPNKVAILNNLVGTSNKALPIQGAHGIGKKGGKGMEASALNQQRGKRRKSVPLNRH